MYKVIWYKVYLTERPTNEGNPDQQLFQQSYFLKPQKEPQ